MAFLKKHGSPGLTGAGNSAEQLRERAIAHEWARHPSCHAAGMRELTRYQAKYPRVGEVA